MNTRYIIRETYAPGYYTYIECTHVFAGMHACRTYFDGLTAAPSDDLRSVEVWSERPGEPRREIASYTYPEE